jgi:hypothetical protein
MAEESVSLVYVISSLICSVHSCTLKLRNEELHDSFLGTATAESQSLRYTGRVVGIRQTLNTDAFCGLFYDAVSIQTI